MVEEHRDEPIAGIMRTQGREKWRSLAAKGAPTFLMLDGAAAGDTGVFARTSAENAALGTLAGDIYRGLPAADRDAWPGGVALALQMLADRSFFPPTVPRAGAWHGGEGPFLALAEGRYLRVVNFHATPHRMAGSLEQQLTRLAQSFAPVSHEDLTGLVDTGEWPHDRPGVVLSFFDGFRDNYEVAAPVLDRLGLVAPRGPARLRGGALHRPPLRRPRTARRRPTRALSRGGRLPGGSGARHRLPHAYAFSGFEGPGAR